MKITIEGIKRTEDGSTVHVIENVKCLAGVFVKEHDGDTFGSQAIVLGGFGVSDKIAVGRGLDQCLKEVDWEILKPLSSGVSRITEESEIGAKPE